MPLTNLIDSKLTSPSSSRAEQFNWPVLAATVLNAGQCAHGDLKIHIDHISEKIRSIVETNLPADASCREKNDFVTNLHAADLYLATACGYNIEAAWSRFWSSYRDYVHDLLRYLCAHGPAQPEIIDGVLVDLFLPNRFGQSRISSYDGRSSLATWLRVIVINRLINETRRRKYEQCASDGGPELVDANAMRRVEASFVVRRYSGVIAAALKGACESLTRKEQLLLLWPFDQCQPLAEIGQTLGIHQSNVSRALDRVTRKLRFRFFAVLSKRHRLTSDSVKECLSVLLENASHSISLLGFLRDAPSELTSTWIPGRGAKEKVV